MKPPLLLHCPNGCQTVATDFKLIRYYGPHRTPEYRCLKCEREFSARHESVFAGFHTDEETIYRVLKALAEGNGIRACARIFDLDKNTVARILGQAAAHCQRVSEHLIRNYHLEERNVSITLRHLGEKFRLQEKAQRPLPAAAAAG
jgi:transposase-like protein